MLFFYKELIKRELIAWEMRWKIFLSIFSRNIIRLLLSRTTDVAGIPRTYNLYILIRAVNSGVSWLKKERHYIPWPAHLLTFRGELQSLFLPNNKTMPAIWNS